MEESQFEYDIPVPPKGEDWNALSKLRIGGSFVISAKQEQLVRIAAKKRGIKVMMRSTKDGTGRFRVWRIK